MGFNCGGFCVFAISSAILAAIAAMSAADAVGVDDLVVRERLKPPPELELMIAVVGAAVGLYRRDAWMKVIKSPADPSVPSDVFRLVVMVLMSVSFRYT